MDFVQSLSPGTDARAKNDDHTLAQSAATSAGKISAEARPGFIALAQEATRKALRNKTTSSNGGLTRHCGLGDGVYCDLRSHGISPPPNAPLRCAATASASTGENIVTWHRNRAGPHTRLYSGEQRRPRWIRPCQSALTLCLPGIAAEVVAPPYSSALR